MKQLPSTRPRLLAQLRVAARKAGDEWGDEEQVLWRQFEQRYKAAICGIGKQRRLSPADCDALATDVLSDVQRYLRDFDYNPQRGRFRDWLRTIVHSKATDINRRQRRQRREPFPSSALIDAAALDPAQQLSQQEALDRLHNVMAQLRLLIGERDYALVDLVWFQRRTIAQAAECLGLKAPAARQAVARARKAFKKLLEKQGEISADE